MSIQSKLKHILRNPWSIALFFTNRGLLNRLDDERYLRLAFRASMGQKLNLKNPKTFSEKLQWLKLYNRRPEYVRMVDKHDAKEYVAERIGAEYIIPTLGVWDSFDEIDFDALPDRFVLKCTHDSGGLVICKDKRKLDMAAAKDKIERSLKRNFYLLTREWPYKNVKPRIIAEEYVEENTYGELRDYKYYCFNGEAKLLLVVSDRQKDEDMKLAYFDMEKNFLDLRHSLHAASQTPPELPKNFDKMRQLAEILSKDIPHLRVDFYEPDGRILFGELTFFSISGLEPYEPKEWDHTMGEWLILPEKRG